MSVYKDGTRIVPPVLTAPIEVMIRVDGNLNPVIVKIEYDEDGLHFLNQWGMATLSEKNAGEGEIVEKSNDVLPTLHD